jgi:hypothetical protein
MGTFVVGAIMAIAGCLSWLAQVRAHGGYWSFGLGAAPSFAIATLPLVVGIALLYFDTGSSAGRALLLVGLVVIAVGILAHAGTHYHAMPLYSFIADLALVVAGVGSISNLVFTSAPPQSKPEPPPTVN